MPNFGEFSGTLAASLVATQFGFGRRSYNHTYGAMTHSVVARQGEWTVVEQGATKARGSLPAQARVTVRREAGKVSYWINGNQVYISSVPIAGEVFGAALLYSLGDAVDAPSIKALAQVINVYAEAPRWRMLASDAPVAGVMADIPKPLLIAALRRIHGVSRFSALVPHPAMLAADRPIAIMSGVLPRARMRATLGFLERVPNQLVAIMPPPIVSMNLRSGGVLTVRARLPAIAALATDRPLAYVRAAKPLVAYIRSGAPYMADGEYDGMDNVIAADSSQLDAALLLLGIDRLGIASSATLTIVLELSTMDAVRVASASSFGQMMELMAMDSVAVFSSTSTARHQAIQYAVNALTGAPTTYEGFDFQAFATVDGVTYGIRSDGLYRIGDATDNGELINALIDFGTSDFGDSHVKRAEMAYLGLRTDGQCYLRVRGDDGAERVYRVSGDGSVKRSTLAKGVAARNWSIQLEVADASYAEVDSFELLVGATQRRGSGYRTR
ncbi:hypothetical protein BVH03_21870 [Pseudomonas sp. PA15(2017)]|uniref:hypothetical protein n=1 Tax=Pseudomonas sp. PA15(2017) TaxID=1932111 RepID=UPI000965C84D|nr:hypothetical protein [Pseudomonas sp. PA15(2017)]OLU22903.1 hypothetical protein BVH03_21870 [Pseudomonas sp. PA15(2017)]